MKTTAEQTKFIASPTIFDVFNANPGVTLIEGGRTKTYTGPKQEKSAFTIMSLSSNINETNPIRLSKNEYMQLTRGGNLSRSQNYSSSTTEKEKKQIGKLADEPKGANILTKENLAQEGGNTSNLSDGLKDLNIQMSRMKQKKHETKENNIKVNSNKMRKFIKLQSMNSICIFSDPNWSKFSSSSGFLPVLKAGMKPGNKDFERALGRRNIWDPR